MRTRALSLLAFLLLAGSATAAVLGREDAAGAEASAVAAQGSFSFANSREGMPIFSATGIGPGDSVGGTVEIADTGSLPGELTLSQHDLSDAAGVGGGLLSSQMELRVTDVSAPGRPVTVYSGPLATMPPQRAGRVEPGGSRRYEFLATLPDSGASQNDLQEASTSVAYAWTATEAPPREEPRPEDPRMPTEPAGPGAGANGPAGGGAPPAPTSLTLAITRARRALRHSRLLVWARCDSPCSISARGRVRARGPRGQRGARVRFSPRTRYRAGAQRLQIRLPRKLRRWLRAQPARVRLRAKLVFTGRSPAGAQATARRALRVRVSAGSRAARESRRRDTGSGR